MTRVRFASYETAWAWMHKLRRAMVHPDRDLLGGQGASVEIDRTFIGGRTHARSGSRYANKAEIAIAVERQHLKALGCVWLAHIDSAHRSDELLELVRHSIADATIVYTDGEVSFRDITSKLRLTHHPIAMVHAADPAHELLPAVHRVAALLKRWLAGTFHDAWGPNRSR